MTDKIYCVREHDGSNISNGKWYWCSGGFGGVSAIDYLIKVKEYSFVEAIELLTGITADLKPPIPVPKDGPKEQLLPPNNKAATECPNTFFVVVLTFQSCRNVLQTVRFLKAPNITILYLSKKTKAEHPSMPTTVAR